MGWSLWVLLLMGLGLVIGRLKPMLIGFWRWAQGGAVALLLFSMGTALRGMAAQQSAGAVYLAGTVVGLASVAGSVVAARLYRKYLHGGEPL
jgi:hypothetical protein